MGFAVGGWLRTLKNLTTLGDLWSRSLRSPHIRTGSKRDVELDISAEAALQAALAETAFRSAPADATRRKYSCLADAAALLGVASMTHPGFRCSKQHEISTGLIPLGACFATESDD